MKVHQLIEKLASMPPHYEVRIDMGGQTYVSEVVLQDGRPKGNGPVVVIK